MRAATIQLLRDDYANRLPHDISIIQNSDTSEQYKNSVIRDLKNNLADWDLQLAEALKKSGGYAPKPKKISDTNELTAVLEQGETYYLYLYTNREFIGTTTVEYLPRAFQDVTIENYYYEPVKWAADRGVTRGTGPQTFSPDSTCTRAEVVTFLWRIQGSPAASHRTSFVDVRSDAYYADAVSWAASQGITNGTDPAHFSPNRTCTRAEVVTLLYRALASKSFGWEALFVDVPNGTYYSEAVTWAYYFAITNGTDDTHFSPDAGCTRAQIVTFLYRARS